MLSQPERQLDIKCQACSTVSQARVETIPDFEYAIPGGACYGCCSNCGSFTHSPMPGGAELASYYPANYHSFLPPNILSRLRQRMRLAQLKRLGKTGTILDFGCGQGMFLNALAESFPDGRFLGYEIGERNEKEERYGGRVTIFRGNPDFFWDNVSNVDLVTMNHVIEHLPNPIETVRSIRSILSPQGRVEGQTPNADCYERLIFGSCWSGFHSPRHTVVFSKRGLETLLKDAGFATVHVTSGWNPASWAVSIGSVFQDATKPTGITRQGIWWLALIAAGLVPSLIESRTQKSGIIDFVASAP